MTAIREHTQWSGRGGSCRPICVIACKNFGLDHASPNGELTLSILHPAQAPKQAQAKVRRRLLLNKVRSPFARLHRVIALSHHHVKKFSNFINLASIPSPKRVLMMLLAQLVLSGSTSQPAPSDSNPVIMGFGISVLPPHVSPSTNDRPPLGPLGVSHSEHDGLIRSSSTWALPSLECRREALRSRGHRAPNPLWRLVCSSRL